MSEWAQNPAQTAEVVAILQALRDPSRPDHKAAVGAIQGYVANEDFILHLIYIFSRGQVSPDIRQLAGLVSKNYVLPRLEQSSGHVQNFLKQEFMAALSDPSSDIRKTASILFGRFAETFPVEQWVDVLPPLFHMLDIKTHKQAQLTEGGIHAIRQICEDSSKKLASCTARPLDQLVPTLISLLGIDIPSIRLSALLCLKPMMYLLDAKHNESIRQGIQPLIIHLSSFLQAISALASDALPETRSGVCQCITIIAEVNIAALEPIFPSICEFMIEKLGDDDEHVGMEACDFWQTLIDLEEEPVKAVFVAQFPTMLPRLVAILRLSDTQRQQEADDEEAEATGEKKLNFKPVHHRANRSDGDGDDADTNWYLRKAAGSLLDNIGTQFSPDLVLGHALPPINALLQRTDVWLREAGMLALGALAAGCCDAMEPHLPAIFPFLMQNLADPNPEVRSVACWAISRYCQWIFNLPEEDVETAFNSVLKGLFQAMLDPVPKVQCSACSALITLMEGAGDSMGSYVTACLTVFQQCMAAYGVKSKMLLIDTLATLADCVGTDLAEPAFTALYLPALMAVFRAVPDYDMHLFPVLECLSSITVSAGMELQPVAQEIYTRSLQLAGNTFAANAGGTDDAPVKDFTICGLDVVTGLCEGLGEHFPTLVAATDSAGPLIQLALCCARDELPQLRQSALALLGELCRSSPGIITPHAVQVLEVILPNLQLPDNVDAILVETGVLVCNNACWSLGELAVKVGGALFAPVLGRIVQCLVELMGCHRAPATLMQNAVICLGRLGVTNTTEMAAMLPDFFEDYCRGLAVTTAGIEQEHAFMGLVQMLHTNPAAISSNPRHGKHLLLACGAWSDPPEEQLLQPLSVILQAVVSQLGSLLVEGREAVDPEVLAQVRDMFRLK